MRTWRICIPAENKERVRVGKASHQLMQTIFPADGWHRGYGRGHGPIARVADQSVQHESDKVLVVVQDSGIRLQPGSFDHLFEAFFTTNPQGMRKELGISRSTVEDHGRRLWAVSTDCYDATFQFTVSKYHLSSVLPQEEGV